MNGPREPRMPPLTPHDLGRLYRQHAPALRLYARQWPSCAEDLVQDAFVALARQNRPPEQVVPWLYQVVRNGATAVARLAARRRRRETVASVPEAWFSPTDDRLDAADAARALADLPLENREVIVARLWGGLTFDDVSRLVGCSLPTAHRRYHAGLTELRTKLGAPCNQTPTT
jgi:RNA polymerase sigma-70 factor (ECF subfamily)